EILRTAKGPELDAESQHHLQTIADASRHMSRLIDDLLAFSRAARMELRKADVDLGQLVRETLSELAADAAGREVEWVVGKLPQALGDANLLRQVFFNLIGNALKYTRPRNPARIEIGSRADPRELVV